jgi:hypothetical protein
MPNERRRRSEAVRPSGAEDRKDPPAEVTDDAIRGRAISAFTKLAVATSVDTQNRQLIDTSKPAIS